MTTDKKKGKKLPVHVTDKAAQDFTDQADLSEYDLTGFEPASFEFQRKDARLELRVSPQQLEALKVAAKEQGIPHTRLARLFIEQGMKALSPR